MAVTATEFNEYKKRVDCHDEFINGNDPDGKDGAKTRLTRVEDTLMRRDKASNYIIAMCYTVIGAVIVFVITKLLIPALGG